MRMEQIWNQHRIQNRFYILIWGIHLRSMIFYEEKSREENTLPRKIRRIKV